MAIRARSTVKDAFELLNNAGLANPTDSNQQFRAWEPGGCGTYLLDDNSQISMHIESGLEGVRANITATGEIEARLIHHVNVINKGVAANSPNARVSAFRIVRGQVQTID